MRIALVVVVFGLAGCSESEPKEPTCSIAEATGSVQLTAVIEAAPGIVDLPVSEVTVTLVKPASSNEAGFFVQAERGGPAVFVLADAVPAGTPSPAVGDRVSFRVTQKRFESSAVQVARVDGWITHESGTDIERLRQDVSSASELASAVHTYESTLVRAEVTVTSAWLDAARGHLRAEVATDGLEGPPVVVRLPATLVDVASYPVGCTFQIRGVVWRFADSAQLSTYQVEDIGSCQSPSTKPPASEPARCDALLPVQRVGSEDTLDIGSWNLRGFPLTAETPALAGDAILAMDLDFVGLQELARQDTFDQLLAALPGYAGLLSEDAPAGQDFYLVRGLVYRTSVLTLMEQGTLLVGDPFFAIGVLMARFAYAKAGVQTEITVIVVHLKAGGTAADNATRTEQMLRLEAAVRARVDGGSANIVILGDFNQDPSEPMGTAVWQPFLGDPDRYALTTNVLVPFDASHSNGRFLDHIVMTRALADASGPLRPTVVHLERALSAYNANLSDHLPVAVALPLR